ncbi:MAG: glycosyltransferase, partial [Candidatus Dormibacteraeota bacterium]|nr:glycosyltransferase [Candidatus Dormibacteraeota bacterium]
MTNVYAPRKPLRVGVDLRILGIGRRGIERGIPRFIQEQLQSLLALDTESTYLLLCDPGADLGVIRPEIRGAPNVQVVCGPDDPIWCATPWHDEASMLAKSSAYQRWVERLRLDVYHATAPVPTCSLTVPDFDACPYVATAYDLIPLIYPAQFHPDGAAADTYHRCLLFTERATRLAAISEATARDLVRHLGVPPDRIDITPPAPSPTFRRLPPDVTRVVLGALNHPSRRGSRRRVRIPSEYVLAVSALHYTKNLPNLFGAYAALSGATRERFPLVLGGHLEADEIPIVWRLAEHFGIDSDVVLTGRLAEGELAALYNGATVVVHASHYEGFGLPVVEAMRCGAPVITGTRSSLPEVAGDAAILVDSEDTAALTQAIASVVHDEELRHELRRRGFEQAARHTPEALAAATAACYQRAASANDAAATTLRVALWSPVPPQLSGVADYAEDLILALAQRRPDVDLEVFVDDGVLPQLHLMRSARIHHHSAFERRLRQAPFDVCVYQAGAARLHMYMEEAMVRSPGVLVLHDLHWSRAVHENRLEQHRGAMRFRGELALVEGEAAARQWDALQRLPVVSKAARQAFLDEHPMLAPLVSAATTCVTLSPEIGAELRRRYPRAVQRVIPLGVSDPAGGDAGFDRATARSYAGLDQRTFVVAALGLLDPAKHLETLLASFAVLLETRPDAMLVIVGWSDPAYAAALREEAGRLGIAAAVRVAEGVPRRMFEAYAVASDVIVTLRDPGLKQMSTAVLRSLAAGRPLVMSDIAAWRSIPDDACVRVAAAPHEGAELS